MVLNVFQIALFIIVLNCFYIVVRKFVDELLAIKEQEKENQYVKLQHIDIKV